MENTKNPAASFPADRTRFAAGLIASCIGLALMLAALGMQLYKPSDTLEFALLELGILALLVLLVKRGWCTILRFTPAGIRIKRLLRKAEEHSYREYGFVCLMQNTPRVQDGRPYIAFSSRPLEELSEEDAPLLAVAYSGKNYQTLLAALPRDMADKLREARSACDPALLAGRE